MHASSSAYDQLQRSSLAEESACSQIEVNFAPLRHLSHAWRMEVLQESSRLPLVILVHTVSSFPAPMRVATTANARASTVRKWQCVATTLVGLSVCRLWALFTPAAGMHIATN